MNITIFPALNGDCILIEYINGHHVLVDGGYVNTYNDYLQPTLTKIAKFGKMLDLVIVSHIDADHISGIIKMLEEDTLPISIQNIWHNAYRHIQSPVVASENREEIIRHNIAKEAVGTDSRKISAKQGSTLAALIQLNKLAWNKQFSGNAVVSPTRCVVNNATFYILSPNQDCINSLALFWKRKLIQNGLLAKNHCNEFWDDAFDFSLSQDKPGFHIKTKNISKTNDIKTYLDIDYTADTSVTNESSISFLLEANGKKILMLGDAKAESIINSLNDLYTDQQRPIWFDAIKLSHHGSFNNNSPELLKMIDSTNWIVSTNGDLYNHPDKEVIAHIITKDKINERNIIFNYRLDVCAEFDTSELHSLYKFQFIVPENNVPSIVTL